MNAAISISYSGDHRKGDGQILDGAEHAEMLNLIVKRCRSEVDWPIFICCTSFDGFTPYSRISDHKEQAMLWELFAMDKVWFVTVPENPGHLEGSTFSIRQGLEAARCDYLLHMCEDVVPERGIIKWMVDTLSGSYLLTGKKLRYIGEQWREKKDMELSTQFFACDRNWFFDNFDGKGNGKLVEAYMGDILKDENIKLIPRLYKHTHTPSEFMRLLEE